MISQKKWLITGAAGFIGSHVADHLLTQKQHVIGIDNFSTGTSANVARLQQKHGNHWQCVNADIRDKLTINQLFDYYRPDYVIHLAAQVSVPLSIQNPQKTQSINIEGFLNVLLAAKKTAAHRFIYASSSAVYGEQTVLPIAETAKLQPLSFYGLSKKINEDYAALYADQDFHCIGLRFFNVFGPYQRADSPYSGVIAQWLMHLKASNPITIYGDGTASRDYCYITNVAQAIQQVTEAALPGVNHVYNIGNGQVTTLQELSHVLIKITGQPAEQIKYAPWRTGDILHSQASIQLAQQEWNFKPVISLEKGLQLILHDQAAVKQ